VATNRQKHHSGETPVADYTLLEVLGKGGTGGSVWKARAPGGLEVAIKFLPLDEDLAKREARALLKLARQLRHPNLLPIHSVYLCDEDGHVYDAASSQHNDTAEFSEQPQPGRETVELPAGGGLLEMIIIMGLADQSLYDRLKQCRREGLPGIPAAELLIYMEQAARGIDYLNRSDSAKGKKEIQHGDIKPQNILLVGEGVQICDYGLAKQVQHGEVRMTSGPAGSPPYMAPEVLISKKPGPKTDQYSLAITYFELRTGRLPFPDESDVYEIQTAHRRGTLELSALENPDEQQVISKATSLAPTGRFDTAMQMVEKLKHVVVATPAVPLSDSRANMTGGSASVNKPQRETIPVNRPLVRGDTLLGLQLDEQLVRDDATSAWFATANEGTVRRIVYVRDISNDGVDRRALRLLEECVEHPHFWKPRRLCLVDAFGHPAEFDDAGRVQPPAGCDPANYRLVTAIAVGPFARKSLAMLLDESGYKGIPPDQLIPYMRQLAEVLDYLNARAHQTVGRRVAIVHGNVQPEHCLLVRDKLTSHFVVQLANGLCARTLEGDTGEWLSTARPPAGRYAAPELADGQVTRWSDQYSLAASYVRLRTGHALFDAAASTERVAAQRRRGDLDLQGLNDAERTALVRATANDPQSRFFTCCDFVTELEKALFPGDRGTVPVPDGQAPLASAGPATASSSFASARVSSRSRSELAIDVTQAPAVIEDDDDSPLVASPPDTHRTAATVDATRRDAIAPRPSESRTMAPAANEKLQPEPLAPVVQGVPGSRSTQRSTKSRVLAAVAVLIVMGIAGGTWTALVASRTSSQGSQKKVAGGGEPDSENNPPESGKEDLVKLIDELEGRLWQVPPGDVLDTLKKLSRRFPDLSSKLAGEFEPQADNLRGLCDRVRRLTIDDLFRTAVGGMPTPAARRRLEALREFDFVGWKDQRYAADLDTLEDYTKRDTENDFPVQIAPIMKRLDDMTSDTLLALCQSVSERAQHFESDKAIEAAMDLLDKAGKTSDSKAIAELAKSLRGLSRDRALGDLQKLAKQAEAPSKQDWRTMRATCEQVINGGGTGGQPPKWIHTLHAECLVALREFDQAKLALERAAAAGEDKPYRLFVAALLQARGEERPTGDFVALADRLAESCAPPLHDMLKVEHRRLRAMEILSEAAERTARLHDGDPPNIDRLADPFSSKSAADKVHAWLSVVDGWECPDQTRQRQMRQNLAVAAYYRTHDEEQKKIDDQLANTLTTLLVGDDEHAAEVQILLIHAATCPSAQTALALECYSKALKRSEALDKDLVLDQYERIVEPALKLEVAGIPDDARPSLASLWNAKGRFIELDRDVETRAHEATSDAIKAQIDAFSEAIRLEPSNVAHHIQRGLARLRADHPDSDAIQSEDIVPILVNGEPASPEAYFLRGLWRQFTSRSISVAKAEEKFSRLDEAIADLREAAATSPRQARSYAHVLVMLSSALVEKANARPGDEAVESWLTEAAALAKTAVEEFPHRPRPQQAFIARGNALEDFGLLLKINNGYQTAIEAFDQAVSAAALTEIDPAEAKANRGRCLYRLVAVEMKGDPQALRANKLVGDRTLKAYLQQAKNDLDDAIGSGAIRSSSKARAYCYRARVHSLENEYENAYGLLKNAIKIASDVAPADVPRYRVESAVAALAAGARQKNPETSKKWYTDATGAARAVIETKDVTVATRVEAVNCLVKIYLEQTKIEDALQTYVQSLPKEIASAGPEYCHLLTDCCTLLMQHGDTFWKRHQELCLRCAEHAARLAGETKEPALIARTQLLLGQHHALVYRAQTDHKSQAAKDAMEFAVRAFKASLDSDDSIKNNAGCWISLASMLHFRRVEIGLPPGAADDKYGGAAVKRQLKKIQEAIAAGQFKVPPDVKQEVDFLLKQ